jgi:hypothetical protein
MPFYLREKDVLAEVADSESVLIVPCRFCPAASAAVEHDEPYIEFPRRWLQTASYERFIESLKSGLEKSGIKTDVFRSRSLHQFVLCMWSSRRREKLAQRATEYDTVLVIGCEAAVDTVRDALRATSCRVVRGMETVGIMSIQPRLGMPGTIRLELQGISPTSFPEAR